MRRILSCLLIISLFVYVDCASAQSKIHPDADLVPGSDDITYRISDTEALRTTNPSMRADAKRIREASRVLSIGERDGTTSEVIGTVSDIVVNREDGTLLLVDESMSMIRFYDRDGTFLSSFGRSGQGPNEFAAPDQLFLFGDSLLAVSEPRRVSIKIYVRRGETFEYRNRVTHGIPMSKACRLGDRLVVKGMKPSGDDPSRPILHTYSTQGDASDSFGQGYQATDRIMSLQISGGPLGCTDDGRVVAALAGTSFIFGYDQSGERKWLTGIQDYEPVQVKELDNGANFSRGKVSDVTRTITPLPSGNFIVQVKRIRREGQYNRKIDIRTYLLDGSTGYGSLVSTDLPLILEATSTRLYTFEDYPFPRIHIYDLEKQ